MEDELNYLNQIELKRVKHNIERDELKLIEYKFNGDSKKVHR